MNQLEFARIHEMQFHGDIRFHLRLHEMTKEPLWPEPVPPHWHEEYEFLVVPLRVQIPATGGGHTIEVDVRKEGCQEEAAGYRNGVS